MPMAVSSFVEPVFLLRAPQAHEQARGGEEPDGYCVHARGSSQGDGEKAFTGTDRPIEHKVLAFVDEFEGLELGTSQSGGILRFDQS